jgi:hypothetical protein
VRETTDTHGDATTQAAEASTQPGAGDPGLLTSRCLQDARSLLNNLISPNRNQEPSSHDSP